jgi:hypothetical protein
MTPTIGFVVLSHEQPSHLLRLTKTLNRLFDNPPISIHHDQSRSVLDAELLSSHSTYVVEDYVATEWGRFGLVDGTIHALKLMASKTSLPDWIFLVSASCYPTKPSSTFLSHLETTIYDAYIGHELIDPNNITRPWHQTCCERYLNGENDPFNTLSPCFAGSQWFHANRRSIEYLINLHDRNPLLRQYYTNLEKQRGLIIPDESYIQTILANNYSLSLCQDNMHFVDWTGGGPTTLEQDHLDSIRSSNCLFARKFNTTRSASLLEELDRELGI